MIDIEDDCAEISDVFLDSQDPIIQAVMFFQFDHYDRDIFRRLLHGFRHTSPDAHLMDTQLAHVLTDVATSDFLERWGNRTVEQLIQHLAGETRRMTLFPISYAGLFPFERVDEPYMW